MTLDAWLTVKEAAFRLGYHPDYFRKVYCDPNAPLVTIRQSRGPKGRRRLLVEAAAILKLIESQTQRSG